MTEPLAKGWLALLGLFFLVAIHYLQMNMGGEGLELPFNCTGWMAISLMLGIGCWQVTRQQAVTFSRLTLQFALIIVLLCVPLFYPGSEVASMAEPRLLGLFAGWLFLCALQQFRFSRDLFHQMLYLAVGAVLIEALWGAVQYFAVGRWDLIPGKWLGFYPERMRPHGIFQQPNVMASFIATGLALSLYLVNRSRWHIELHWARRLNYAMAFFGGLLLLLNLSRSGFVGMIVALLLLIPLAKVRPAQSKRWLAMLILGLVLANVAMQSADSQMRKSEEVTQAGLRLPTYQHSLEMIAQKPLLGWGYGAFEVAFIDSVHQPDDIHKEINFGNMAHPHNELLYWTIEGGIVPLLALLYAFWVILSLLMRAKRVEGMAMLALLFPMLFHSMTEYPFYHSVGHWILFVMLLGYLASQVEKPRSVPFRYTFFLRTAALLVPLLTAAFMITALMTTHYIVRFEQGKFEDPEPLMKIINPLVHGTRVDWDVMSYRLKMAGKLDHEHRYAEAAVFAAWAEQTVKHTSRDLLYFNWGRALEAMGERQKALRVYQEGLRLYPNNPHLLGKIAQWDSASSAQAVTSSAAVEPSAAVSSAQ